MKQLTGMTRRSAIAAMGALALTACGATTDENGPSSTAEPTPSHPETGDMSGHGGHSPDGGPPPEGIKEATDPTYPVGATVILTADHMPGMQGADATIAGAFDTTTYSVTYTPTTGGEPVVDHKWVVHEELKNPGDAPLAKGTKVVLNADHMPGMKGAEATIESSTDETVYMVDYEMDGMKMTNHKWVVESEIKPAE